MEKFGYVLATKMLVEKKLPIMFMYRETGHEGDSGWRFFSGFESQEYVDDPENIAIYDIETILNIDESIRPYLSSGYNSAYERSCADDKFEQMFDFDFGSNFD